MNRLLDLLDCDEGVLILGAIAFVCAVYALRVWGWL